MENSLSTAVVVCLFCGLAVPVFVAVEDFTYEHPEGWMMHCDMVKQFVTCLDQRLKANNQTNNEIYVDAWRSLNQRFHQRCVRIHEIIVIAW